MVDKVKKDTALLKTIEYMKAHWPSGVKKEWQVGIDEYPAILKRVMMDFTRGKSQQKYFVRIAGLSGSGKTTQLLPAAGAYFEERGLSPVLVAARKFVEYHPYYQEILDYYGEAELRKMTDEFSTIMMFMTLNALTEAGYDIILDVTLLDPEIERILLGMISKYEAMMLMVAVAPEVAERQLGRRNWRHSRETELEFVRATGLALEFYAASWPEMRVVMWDVFDTQPIYDGAIKNATAIFNKYSSLTDIPEHDESMLREAKIRYLTSIR